MRFIIKTVNIFIAIIINKSFFIFFIFNRLEKFIVKIENYSLDYWQDDLGNKNFIFIN